MTLMEVNVAFGTGCVEGWKSERFVRFQVTIIVKVGLFTSAESAASLRGCSRCPFVLRFLIHSSTSTKLLPFLISLFDS